MSRNKFEPTYDHGAPIYARTYGIAAPLSSFPYWSRENNGMPVDRDNAAVKYISGPGINSTQKQVASAAGRAQQRHKKPKVASRSSAKGAGDEKAAYPLGWTWQMWAIFAVLVVIVIAACLLSSSKSKPKGYVGVGGP